MGIIGSVSSLSSRLDSIKIFCSFQQQCLGKKCIIIITCLSRSMNRFLRFLVSRLDICFSFSSCFLDLLALFSNCYGFLLKSLLIFPKSRVHNWNKAFQIEPTVNILNKAHCLLLCSKSVGVSLWFTWVLIAVWLEQSLVISQSLESPIKAVGGVSGL